jgi:hypothetical protein
MEGNFFKLKSNKMKQYIGWSMVVISSLIAFSCSKGNSTAGLPASSVSLTIVNLINGSHGFYTNFSPQAAKGSEDTLKWYRSAANVSFGNFLEFSSYTGMQALSIVSETDTLESEWSGVLSLPIWSVQTIFFGGPDTSQIDTLLTTDQITYYATTDSVIGVRFVNMAWASNPVSVDIQGAGSAPLVASLSYKGATAFMSFPATSESPSSGQYTFEFRVASSGALLASYQYSGFQEFQSATVVLGGNANVGGGGLYAYFIWNEF